MKPLGHDLFLLMLNLSQLRNQDRILALFIEAMNTLQDHVVLRLVPPHEVASGQAIAIATTSNMFGWVEQELRKDDNRRDDVLSLVRNATKMLAIVLENQMRAQLLANENVRLEGEVQVRTQALTVSEERYRSLVEFSPVPILVVRDGQLVYANPAAVELSGAQPGTNLLGQSLAFFVHPDDRARLLDLLRELEEQPYTVCYAELKLVRLDNRLVDVEMTGMQLNYSDVLAQLIICVDVTERKRSEEELRRYRHHLEDLVKERTAKLEALNEELRALSRVKDEFVSNVSHELRTPITNLRLRQHLLARQPDRLDLHLPVIQRETARLSHIIEGLLRLSRLDQDRVNFEINPVDLNALVSQYISDRMLLASDRGLTLTFHSRSNGAFVLADAELIGQALSIVLTNALSYTPAGGCVAISVKQAVQAGQEWVGIAVADTGPGIPQDEMPRLFERFFRGQTGLSSGEPGTGLGLAIMAEIVKRHQGWVDIVSSDSPGSQGSVFTIWLPKHHDAAQPSHTS